MADLVFVVNYEYIEQNNCQKDSGFCGRVQSVKALPGLLIGNIERWVGGFLFGVFAAIRATITNTG